MSDLKKALGVCLGATSLSIVEIEKKDNSYNIVKSLVEEHQGDPKGVLSKILGKWETDGRAIAVTGRKFRELINLPSITEPEATEIAYQYIKPKGNIDYDVIVSAGGETFIVYELDKKDRISQVVSGNKCASGTGEFFMQQIRRMNVSIDEAIELSKTATNPHHLSGRCSVFCKSDCTHALNKGESIADVAAGLAKMIAKKISELLVRLSPKNVLIVGGTSQNEVVVNYVKENFPLVNVPAEAPYFEALGAAIWAFKSSSPAINDKNKLYKDHQSSFEFLKSIKNYEKMVTFKDLPFKKAKDGDELVVGLDVGSTTTKAVLMDLKDNSIVGSIYLRTNGNPIEASRQCYKALLDSLNGANVKITGVGVTGSGRYIAGLHADTDGVINEIIAHATASSYFDKDVDTIFEIGGQDAKYTFLTNGVASDYAMNEACSAGTGSFLEESAYEQLGVKMEDIAGIALNAATPPNFSDQCAAFISSDINTAFQEGVSKEDIIAGLVYSICINYVNRVKGSRQVGKKVFMQGGVCYNKAVPIAMAALTGREIIVPPHPGLMGAYGVALELKNLFNIGNLDKKEFSLPELAERKVEYGKPFKCHGHLENCDIGCEVAMIHINNKKIPFGGACNKYYNLKNNKNYDIKNLNHIEKRVDLLFEDNKIVKPAKKDIVIGINRSFQINTLYPMFYTFFNELGCKVVMPDHATQEGIDKGLTSFCLSGQISLGMFDTLLKLEPDYIFMPQIMEIHVSEQEEYRKEYQTVCMFVQGEPFYQQASFFKDLERDGKKVPKMITPALNLMSGFDSEEKTFIKVATDLGFTAAEGKEAHRKAVEAQLNFFKKMKAEGKRILAELERDPNKRAIVLFGRPYNAFANETNKGVPFKFASRGVEIIPYDFLLYEDEENYKKTYWEMGQRIIKAARIVKRHPQLFACYLTNFLCALDSMMIPHFRDLMGTKPSLTIEVDGHTADAGVNTRIEAFMDVINNYVKIRDKIQDKKTTYVRAKTEIDNSGGTVYIDSEGKKFSFKDKKSVKVVVPSMGDLFAEGAAAVLRRQGWNAEALPVCDREALDLGRSVTTSKECLPIINIIGELLKYLKYRENKDEKLVMFLVSAGGCCRVGQYEILTNTVIDKLQLNDVALITLENDSGYAGLGMDFRINAGRIIFAGDILDDIRSVIKAMSTNKGRDLVIFKEEWLKICDVMEKKGNFYKQLKLTAKRLKDEIKLARPLKDSKYVGVVGEIFVRRDHFSLMGIPEKLAKNGFVMLDAHVTEWLRYVEFLQEINMFETKTNFVGKIEAALTTVVMDTIEKRTKKIFEKSGLYEREMLDIKKYMEHSTHIFPWTLTGEPGLSTGASMYHLLDKYCGVINVGPFGCMNSRMTEGVTTAYMNIEGKEEAAKKAKESFNAEKFKENMDILPFLSVECDGNPFSQILEARLETFMLQADRAHEEMMKNKK